MDAFLTRNAKRETRNRSHQFARIYAIVLKWYPRLEYGTPQECAAVELWNDGTVIAWPQLDEHISVEAIIAGTRSQEGASSFQRWKTELNTFRREGRTPEWGIVKPLPTNL